MANPAPLAVTMGDPAGCGPAITAMAWQQLRPDPDATFFVFGDPALYQDRVPIEEIASPSDAFTCFGRALPVLSSGIRLGRDPIPGSPDPQNATATIESIRRATTLALEGAVAGVVTNPISKAQLYKAGFAHPGHTEFISALCSTHENREIIPVMMLLGGGLKVALATIHVPLMEVVKIISTERLVKIGNIVANDLRTSFGIDAPRLAFTGLNPHAGESGTIGTEEIDIINPAAAVLRGKGVDIADARSADTVFHEALTGRFDAVIAMTHDQGLIPVKTLDMWGGVNLTLGLPIVRTSPDHGTAYEAARTGSERPGSLVAAIRLAHEIARNRNTIDA